VERESSSNLKLFTFSMGKSYTIAVQKRKL